MNRGRGKDQPERLRGVTRRVTQSHKVLFCTAQGNSFGPGYVFLGERVTPGNLPWKAQAISGKLIYLHHCVAPRANCFPSWASSCAPQAIRAVVLPGKRGCLGTLPEVQVNKLYSLRSQLPGANF